MRVRVEPELKDICEQILVLDRSEDEWAEHESCDMFQTANFCGGFDACDRAFCFGKFENGEEIYAVQVTLEQIPLITSGIMKSIEVLDI